MAVGKKLTPQEAAATTDKWTKLLFRALSARVSKRWRFVSFRGSGGGGGERKGIVDILAIRKDTSKSSHELLKTGELFDFVLVQMKGGSAKAPSAEAIGRLKAVKAHYGAGPVVLFSSNRKSKSKSTTKSEVLGSDDKWKKSSAVKVFGT